MHEAEAIALRNRLIGAGALCLLVFVVSLFIPEPNEEAREEGVVIDLGADAPSALQRADGGAPAATETLPAPSESAPSRAQAAADQEALPATPSASAPAPKPKPTPKPEQNAPQMTAESPAPAAPPSDPEPSSNSTTSSRATEASAPSPATGRWWIQAASYSDPDTAQAGRQRAEKQGFRVRLKEVRIEGKAWWRLQIGPYGDAAAAKTDIGAVEAAGFRGARAIER